MKKSRYYGVSFAGSGRKSPWRSRITVGGLTMDLGYFKTQKDAALAYNEAILSSKLNRPLNTIR